MAEGNPEVFSRLGKLEARDDAQDATLSDVKKSIEEVKTTVRSIEIQIAERKGGTKALFLLLTAAATFGAITDRVISWLKLL